MSIEEKFKATIKKYDMIKGYSTILVAVSGGIDSMALLYVLNKYKDELKIKIKVAHLNHCLRDLEADKDEKLVCEFCKNLDIEFISEKIDIKKIANKNKLGIEECARNERYKLFDKIVGKSGYIATAHTLSESLETVLFNLARGCFKNGLQGIPAVRGNIIRPFIEISKEEIKDYVSKHNIPYREDESNKSLEYNRNKIRHKLVPVLKEINPSLEQVILRLKENLSVDEDYFCEVIDEIYENSKRENGFDIEQIKNLHKALRVRFIQKALHGISLESVHLNLIDDIIMKGKGAVQLGINTIVEVNGSILKVNTKKNTEQLYNYCANFEIPFCSGVISTPLSGDYVISIIDRERIDRIKEEDADLFRNLVSCDIINGTAVFRYRRNSDKFKQIGRGNISKKYKKLMQENNIDPISRNRFLILSDKDNILWLEGFGVSEFAKVKKNTQNAILIQKRGV